MKKRLVSVLAGSLLIGLLSPVVSYAGEVAPVPSATSEAPVAEVPVVEVPPVAPTPTTLPTDTPIPAPTEEPVHDGEHEDAPVDPVPDPVSGPVKTPTFKPRYTAGNGDITGGRIAIPKLTAANEANQKAAKATLDALTATGEKIAEDIGQANKNLDQAKKDVVAFTAAVAEAKQKAADDATKASKARKTLNGVVHGSYMTPSLSALPMLPMLANDPNEAARSAAMLTQASQNSAESAQKTKENAASSKALIPGVESKLADAKVREEKSNTELASASARQVQNQSDLAAATGNYKILSLQVSTSASFSMPAGDMCNQPAPSSYPTSAAWGGFQNGQIPAAWLCGISTGHQLRWDAAAAFKAMDALYLQETGANLCVTDSYRSLEAQIDVKSRKPTLAATPGTSNHGWGLALDMCGGVQSFGTPAYNWMKLNGPDFGWFHPSWAEPTGSKPEAWHFEFGVRQSK